MADNPHEIQVFWSPHAVHVAKRGCYLGRLVSDARVTGSGDTIEEAFGACRLRARITLGFDVEFTLRLKGGRR